jgi:UDP-N-acetyl-D-mannosaminuronic acid dehydrogenase
MEGKLDKLFLKRGPIKRIGVVGMGYVGIPSAVLFARCCDYDFVNGFQRNSKTSGYKISMLNSGISPLKGDEPGLEELIEDVVSKDKFRCTSDFSKIADCDAVTLTIQTPFKSREDLIPDFTPLTEGLRNTGRYLTPGTLVVLESTVTPGTTQGIAREILEEESGLVAGEDFGLAHAPERVMVGRLLRNIREHDRIVGGINHASTKRACGLYGPVLTKGRLIPMNATAAEVTKTAENTFRDLQIAAANQLALYCEAMGINFYDVRTGVDSLKGEGITRAMLWPGAGVGGHCLTKDTYHLERGVRIVESQSLDFPEGKESLYVLAREINDFMPRHMLTLTKKGLESAGKDIRDSKIAILGWAFIPNSDDARETPSEVYYNLCIKEGARVNIHDPHVMNYPGVAISQSIEEVINGTDAIAIFTGHRDYHEMTPYEVSGLLNSCDGAPVIIDGRNVIDPDSWIEKGFIYRGIGRGDKNNHLIC